MSEVDTSRKVHKLMTGGEPKDDTECAAGQKARVDRESKKPRGPVEKRGKADGMVITLMLEA
jgi:hypothetical protein